MGTQLAAPAAPAAPQPTVAADADMRVKFARAIKLPRADTIDAADDAAAAAATNEQKHPTAFVCVVVRRVAFGPTVTITKEVYVRNELRSSVEFALPADPVLVVTIILTGLLGAENLVPVAPPEPEDIGAFFITMEVNAHVFSKIAYKLSAHNWRQTILGAMAKPACNLSARSIFLCLFPGALLAGV